MWPKLFKNMKKIEAMKISCYRGVWWHETLQITPVVYTAHWNTHTSITVFTSIDHPSQSNTPDQMSCGIIQYFFWHCPWSWVLTQCREGSIYERHTSSNSKKPENSRKRLENKTCIFEKHTALLYLRLINSSWGNQPTWPLVTWWSGEVYIDRVLLGGLDQNQFRTDSGK